MKIQASRRGIFSVTPKTDVRQPLWRNVRIVTIFVTICIISGGAALLSSQPSVWIGFGLVCIILGTILTQKVYPESRFYPPSIVSYRENLQEIEYFEQNTLEIPISELSLWERVLVPPVVRRNTYLGKEFGHARAKPLRLVVRPRVPSLDEIIDENKAYVIGAAPWAVWSMILATLIDGIYTIVYAFDGEVPFLIKSFIALVLLLTMRRRITRIGRSKIQILVVIAMVIATWWALSGQFPLWAKILIFVGLLLMTWYRYLKWLVTVIFVYSGGFIFMSRLYAVQPISIRASEVLINEVQYRRPNTFWKAFKSGDIVIEGEVKDLRLHGAAYPEDALILVTDLANNAEARAIESADTQIELRDLAERQLLATQELIRLMGGNLTPPSDEYLPSSFDPNL